MYEQGEAKRISFFGQSLIKGGLLSALGTPHPGGAEVLAMKTVSSTDVLMTFNTMTGVSKRNRDC